EILVLPSSTLLAFTRESEQQKFIILLNLDSSDANAEIGIQKYASLLSKKAGWQLKDVLTSEAFTVQQKVVIPMKGYSTRWLLLQKKNL
ncbi:MAG: alpha-glucosidase C-terminal domain-containing protein, partial [Ilyomonas sp.]